MQAQDNVPREILGQINEKAERMEEGKQGKHQGVRLGDSWNHRKGSCGVCSLNNFKSFTHLYSRHGLGLLAKFDVDVVAP